MIQLIAVYLGAEVDKFKFSSDAADPKLGSPELPRGKIKNDAYFGEMEIHVDEVVARVPLERTSTAAGTLTFRLNWPNTNHRQ